MKEISNVSEYPTAPNLAFTFLEAETNDQNLDTPYIIHCQIQKLLKEIHKYETNSKQTLSRSLQMVNSAVKPNSVIHAWKGSGRKCPSSNNGDTPRDFE